MYLYRIFTATMIDYTYIYKSFILGVLEPFYTSYYPGLLRYTARILGGDLAWLAEDCLQDIVLAAYENRDSMESADQWRAWIFTAIRNRAIELLRKAGSARNYLGNMRPDEIQAAVEADMIEQETMDAFFEAVRSLPDRYREIVELSFRQGLKNTEVAEILHITEVAVRKRKARLIEMLRMKLGNNMDSTTIIMLLGSQMTGHIFLISA